LPSFDRRTQHASSRIKISRSWDVSSSALLVLRGLNTTNSSGYPNNKQISVHTYRRE
jgi:hypothetical protein